MTSTKLYIEIVKKLQAIIVEDGLIAGDKIPSERELSDRLKVGRSSVREALRSLELLGLIETRRGEGTYIKNFGENQLVQILGAFILQGTKKKSDLVETKYVIECECIKLALDRISTSKLNELDERLINNQLSFDDLIKSIIEGTDNFLLYRIWQVLNEYYQTSRNEQGQEEHILRELMDGLKERNLEKVIKAYNHLVVPNL
ncbi:FadR/GntR family transcriptional regulator [Litchfieldia alkalitelluris]|uniref:FadR/GntR family transcriptional regulator n=1 Tax=Litchfieldia alkalitelluris TaxID=304268 RepID=UPI001F16ABBA|nr:GntR family transcriptional regulator [Litchfieldia alkalitelluris]